MGGSDGVGDAIDDLQRARRRQERPIDQGVEGAAGRELHRDDEGAVDLVQIVDPTDAVVLHAPREDDFAFEPCLRIGLTEEFLMQDLQRDALAEQRVDSGPDTPVPTTAELVLEAEAPQPGLRHCHRVAL